MHRHLRTAMNIEQSEQKHNITKSKKEKTHAHTNESLWHAPIFPFYSHCLCSALILIKSNANKKIYAKTCYNNIVKLPLYCHRMMFGVQNCKKKNQKLFRCEKSTDLAMESREMLMLTEINCTINFSTYEREPHFDLEDVCICNYIIISKEIFLHLAHSLIHSLTFVTSDFLRWIRIRSQHSKVHFTSTAACWEFFIKPKSVHKSHGCLEFRFCVELIFRVIKLFNYIDSLRERCIEFPCTSYIRFKDISHLLPNPHIPCE